MLQYNAKCILIFGNIFNMEWFHYKQQVYMEQNPKFPDNFGCWYLYIVDQTSGPKHKFEEKSKLKFKHFDL